MKPITKDTIPAYGEYDGGEVIQLARSILARVRIIPDQDMAAPWKEHDGHGPVREARVPHWHREHGQKKPGEVPLNSPDRNQYQYYYDWAEATRIAKRDGWGVRDPQPGETRKQQIKRAVQHDFDFLRGWVNDDWHWIGITVELETSTGKHEGALWGLESRGDYWRETAAELICEALRDHWRAVQARKREKAERLAWAARGGLTVGAVDYRA